MYENYGEPTVQTATEDIDQRMAHLMNSLKQAEQYAQSQQDEVIREIERMVKQAGDREDLVECLQEIITDIKEDESDHWEICDRWNSHFTALSAGLETEDGEEDEDEDGDTEDEDEDEDADEDEEDEETESEREGE